MTDVNSATEVTLASLRGMTDVVTDPSLATVRLTYTSKEEYKKMARHLGLMEDFRVRFIHKMFILRFEYCSVLKCMVFSERSRQNGLPWRGQLLLQRSPSVHRSRQAKLHLRSYVELKQPSRIQFVL